MNSRFFHHSVRLTLLLVAGFICSANPARASPPPAFEARFENDAEGTWLVYPTIPGWHYRIEGSPTLTEQDFEYLPGSFRYGDGQDTRWWLAPPPPPATIPDPPPPPPPPRHNLSIHVTVYVATDANVQMVELIRSHPAHPWSARLARDLPLRRNPNVTPENPNEFLAAWPFFGLGHSPTESWFFTGSIRPRLLADFESDPGTPAFTPGSPEEQEYQFVLAHWDEVTSHVTPTDEDAALTPPLPLEGELPPPPPPPSVRRFYRAHITSIDTNGNHLPDWWELANAYAPFASAGEIGYADPNLHDADQDGLTNAEEHTIGTDPLIEDTDGDFATDKEEVDGATDPLDDNSCPSFLVAVRRDLLYYISTRSGEGQAEHYWHNRNFMKWSPAAPGWEFFDSESDVESLPASETLRAKLMAKVGFPEIMPDPHPWWYTARHFQAQATLYIPVKEDDGGADLIQHRVWHRGPAPTNGPLITPVLKRHDVGGPPVSTTWFVRALTTPTGENYSEDYIDLLPGLSPHPHQSTPQNDPDGDGFFVESEQIYQDLVPLFYKVHGLVPQLDHESGDIFPGFEIQDPSPPIVYLVEENPTVDRIAHRVITFQIGLAGELDGRQVTWTMEPLYVAPAAAGQPPPPPDFRGSWDHAPVVHRGRFESDPDQLSNFQAVGTTSATTTIDANGFTSIRVNLPPIGFNRARIFAQVANLPDPTDENAPLLSEKFPVVDVEVPAVVVIDPGHGGTAIVDRSSPNNATSLGDANGVKTLEKTLTLMMGLDMRTVLEEIRERDNLSLRIILTRTADVNVGIGARARRAADKGADVFLSLHFNGDADNSTIHGPETLMEPANSGNVNHGQDLAYARRIQDALDSSVPKAQFPGTPGYRDIKQNTNSSVYRDQEFPNVATAAQVQAGFPLVRASLAEIDWITNPDVEADIISGPNAATNRRTIVNALSSALIEDINHQP